MNEFFDLDPNKLDQEWIRQPKLYHKYAMESAAAKKEYEIAKAKLEIADAECDRDIRSNPANYGIEKITESVIQKTILLQSKYKKALKELVAAKDKAAIAGIAVDTLDQKKYALQDLVKLRLADYYAEPQTPKGKIGEAIRQQEKDNAFLHESKKRRRDEDQ